MVPSMPSLESLRKGQGVPGRGRGASGDGRPLRNLQHGLAGHVVSRTRALASGQVGAASSSSGVPASRPRPSPRSSCCRRSSAWPPWPSTWRPSALSATPTPFTGLTLPLPAAPWFSGPLRRGQPSQDMALPSPPTRSDVRPGNTRPSPVSVLRSTWSASIPPGTPRAKKSHCPSRSWTHHDRRWVVTAPERLPRQPTFDLAPRRMGRLPLEACRSPRLVQPEPSVPTLDVHRDVQNSLC